MPTHIHHPLSAAVLNAFVYALMRVMGLDFVGLVKIRR